MEVPALSVKALNAKLSRLSNDWEDIMNQSKSRNIGMPLEMIMDTESGVGGGMNACTGGKANMICQWSDDEVPANDPAVDTSTESETETTQEDDVNSGIQQSKKEQQPAPPKKGFRSKFRLNPAFAKAHGMEVADQTEASDEMEQKAAVVTPPRNRRAWREVETSVDGWDEPEEDSPRRYPMQANIDTSGEEAAKATIDEVEDDSIYIIDPVTRAEAKPTKNKFDLDKAVKQAEEAIDVVLRDSDYLYSQKQMDIPSVPSSLDCREIQETLEDMCHEHPSTEDMEVDDLLDMLLDDSSEDHVDLRLDGYYAGTDVKDELDERAGFSSSIPIADDAVNEQPPNPSTTSTTASVEGNTTDGLSLVSHDRPWLRYDKPPHSSATYTDASVEGNTSVGASLSIPDRPWLRYLSSDSLQPAVLPTVVSMDDDDVANGINEATEPVEVLDGLNHPSKEDLEGPDEEAMAVEDSTSEKEPTPAADSEGCKQQDTMDERSEKAVGNIQSWARTCMAKEQVLVRKMQQALIAIQSWARLCLVQKQDPLRKRKRAVSVIQTAAVVYLMKKQDMTAIKEATSIVAIQSYARRYVVKRQDQLGRRKRAVVAIQTCIIGYFMQKQGTKEPAEAKERSALTLQRWSRLHLVQRQDPIGRRKKAVSVLQNCAIRYLLQKQELIEAKVETKRRSIVVIQAWTRLHLVQRHNFLGKQKRAIVIIQSWARMCLVKKLDLIRRKQQSTIAIQSIMRLSLIQRQNLVEKRSRSITTIQSYSRGYLVQKQDLIGGRKRSIVAIQAAVRLSLIQKQDPLATRKHASLIIQSWTRRYLVQKEGLRWKKKHAIVTIQSAMRRALVQKQDALGKTRGAISVIQSSARRYLVQKKNIIGRKQQSIVTIQAWVRSCLVQQLDIIGMKRQSIVSIQSVMRLSLIQKQELLCTRKRAISVIQSCARMHLVQQQDLIGSMRSSKKAADEAAAKKAAEEAAAKKAAKKAAEEAAAKKAAEEAATKKAAAAKLAAEEAAAKKAAEEAAVKKATEEAAAEKAAAAKLAAEEAAAKKAIEEAAAKRASEKAAAKQAAEQAAAERTAEEAAAKKAAEEAAFKQAAEEAAATQAKKEAEAKRAAEEAAAREAERSAVPVDVAKDPPGILGAVESSHSFSKSDSGDMDSSASSGGFLDEFLADMAQIQDVINGNDENTDILQTMEEFVGEKDKCKGGTNESSNECSASGNMSSGDTVQQTIVATKSSTSGSLIQKQEPLSRREKALLNIQSCARKHLVQKKNLIRRNRCAISIQSCARRFLVEKKDMVRRNRAAVNIQSYARRYLVHMKDMIRRNRASVVIQSRARRYLVQKKDMIRRNRALSKIQCCARMHLVQKKGLIRRKPNPVVEMEAKQQTRPQENSTEKGDFEGLEVQADTAEWAVCDAMVSIPCSEADFSLTENSANHQLDTLDDPTDHFGDWVAHWDDDDDDASVNSTASAPAMKSASMSSPLAAHISSQKPLGHGEDDDVSVMSAATAPVGGGDMDDLSAYFQRARQRTEEEILAGAIQAAILARELESSMAKKSRNRRRNRKRAPKKRKQPAAAKQQGRPRRVRIRFPRRRRANNTTGGEKKTNTDAEFSENQMPTPGQVTGRVKVTKEQDKAKSPAERRGFFRRRRQAESKKEGSSQTSAEPNTPQTQQPTPAKETGRVRVRKPQAKAKAETKAAPAKAPEKSKAAPAKVLPKVMKAPAPAKGAANRKAPPTETISKEINTPAKPISQKAVAKEAAKQMKPRPGLRGFVVNRAKAIQTNVRERRKVNNLLATYEERW